MTRPSSFGRYYSLDYFQEANVKKRKQGAKIAPHCELAAHLQHGSALPLALLDACTLVADGHLSPSVTSLVGGYVIFYMALSLANHAATGAWQYPIIEAVQEAAGWPGVLSFFAALSGLMVGAAHVGVAIAGLA